MLTFSPMSMDTQMKHLVRACALVAALWALWALCGIARAGGPPPTKPAPEMTITSKSPAAVAAYKRARELLESARQAEAIGELNKAVGLDASFVLAGATLGAAMPGQDGDEYLTRAVSMAAGLPEAERLYIDLLVADRAGDRPKVKELEAKIVALVPGDWHFLLRVADRALLERRYADAVERANQVLAMNSKAAVAHNILAYSYAGEAKWDEAIAAAKKQAELLAREPNPQDTLGEILLWAGRFPEAEAAFLRAIKLAPSFAPAWQGVAMSRFYRGDWPKGMDALANQKKAALRADDKLLADSDRAFAWVAAGKSRDATQILVAAEREANAAHLSYIALAPLHNAWIQYWTGMCSEAVLEGTRARGIAEAFPGRKVQIRRSAFLVEYLCQAKKHHPDADATLAFIETANKDRPADDPLLAWVHGAAAAAKGDLKAAVAAMEPCVAAKNTGCLYDRMEFQQKAGDAAGAAKTKEAILGRYDREPMTLIVRGKLGAIKTN
jgi:Flp pilus assembly protein TadD